MRLTRLLMIGLLLVAFLNGCAGLSTRPEPSLSARANQALNLLASQDALPSAVKGLGNISIQTATQRQSARLAWLVELPDKMRAEVLAPTGHSLLTIATDGSYVYILPHGPEARLTKKRARDLYLKHLTGVPVRIEDLLYLLSGRFPVKSYDTAEVYDINAGEYALALKKKWQGVVQAIYFDADLETPYSIDVFSDGGDRLVYRATVRDWQQVEGTRVPREIFFESGRGDTAALVIRRYWLEDDIADDKFVLVDPKQADDD